ncbi:hypothetical protein ACFVXV_42965, partial [Streptomyces sp. NPDC058272]
MNRDLLRDLSAALAAALLVVVAVLVGNGIQHSDHSLFVRWPPVFAQWEPHVGPGTPAAIALAVAVVAYGPVLAARLPWRALLFSAWGTALAWTFSLALVDGWQRGIAGGVTNPNQFQPGISRVHHLPGPQRGSPPPHVGRAPPPPAPPP